MISLVLKNLWSRRKRNGWLLAELVAVSVITWALLDPVLVTRSIMDRPVGYDVDRLCIIEVAMVEAQAARYDAQAADSASRVRDLFRLAERVGALDEVEEAVPLLTYAYPEAGGSSVASFYPGADTTRVLYAPVAYFVPGQPYFAAYGMQSSGMGPTVAELSRQSYGPSDIVITRSLAEALFPEGDALGRWVNQGTGSSDAVWGFGTGQAYRVVGIVEDVAIRHIARTRRLAFLLDHDLTIRRYPLPHLLVRLKPGVSATAFARDYYPRMVRELRSGNLYGRTLMPYRQLHTDMAYSYGLTNYLRLHTALLAFFLLNLCLGVIGAFWLQTRKRTEEAGVMKSFGATGRHIMGMLLGEGWVLSTVAVLAGCLIYLQYAYASGLATEQYRMSSEAYADWIDSFPLHFVLVSGAVYIIVTTVVAIGIYIPARRISRVDPVTALREE